MKIFHNWFFMQRASTFNHPPGKRAARRKFLVISLCMVLLTASLSFSGQKKPVRPTPKDKCPVCGMFVAKYPDFFAEIVFRDGSYVGFDGVRDMLKYYFDLDKYDPAKKRPEIESIYVTDYYDLTLIDGIKAFYVIGSDVYGPMGRELIPFVRRSEAEGFRRDHKGKRVLEFHEITFDTVKGLD